MEGDGVVGVAYQGAPAVVMLVGQGVGDCMGEQWVGAYLDEGGVTLPRRGNGLTEPDGIAKIGHPVLGIEKRCRTGLVDGAEDRDPGRLRCQPCQLDL